MRAAPLVLIASLAIACGAKEKAAPDAAPAPASMPQAVVESTTLPEIEPPDAQARAEAVVNADFNRDKTTRLVMNITTLVGQTSELSGFSTAVQPREAKIDETLSRLGAKVTDAEVVIQLPGAILFDFDSANIRLDAERALTDVARVIQSYPQRPVRVEGHTDSIASDEYNRGLSERRAQSVVAWLAQNGVERSRLAAAGLGETKPVATNDTAAGRQLNRRVEVVIARK